MAQTLVTLNRTLFVQVGIPVVGGAVVSNKVVKMQAFTGKYQHRTQNEVTYKVTAIHLPEEIVPDRPIFVDFVASAVVSTQEVA